ncbi:MAG: DUF1385 domain-containing protein [Clostridia bacterium]|nr:DUF1385 domain-containing protein [Clostridia bacterium]
MKKQAECNPRLGKVGGGAMLEGVMMRAADLCAIACRREDGTLVVREKRFTSLRSKHKFWNLPILRGIVSFIESLVLSYSCLAISAEVMGEAEEETKFEKSFKKHLGVRFFDVLMLVAGILGVVLSLALFLALPRYLAGGIEALCGIELGHWKSAVEGGFKILIFLAYLLLVSLMKEIRRTFEYHGAEHKSIACYEAGDALTPEAARKYSRFHPRCGTSFMFVMILLGVLLGFGVNAIFPGLKTILYVLIRLALLPLVVGVGFEFIRYAGCHQNFVVRLLAAPGLWVQRITTREPDDAQLEVALLSLQYALAEEFPDLDREAYRAAAAAAAEDAAPAEETAPADDPADAAPATPTAEDAPTVE